MELTKARGLPGQNTKTGVVHETVRSLWLERLEEGQDTSPERFAAWLQSDCEFSEGLAKKLAAGDSHDRFQFKKVGRLAKELDVEPWVIMAPSDVAQELSADSIRTALTESGAGLRPSALQAFIAGVLPGVHRTSRLLHFKTRLPKGNRPQRRQFGRHADQRGQAGWGHGLIQPEGDSEGFEAVVSFTLKLGWLDLLVDYGHLKVQGGQVWAAEMWRDGSHMRKPLREDGAIEFVTWFMPPLQLEHLFFPALEISTFLVRSDRKFDLPMRGEELLSLTDGDGRLEDAEDPLVGFPRWSTHRVYTPPWQGED